MKLRTVTNFLLEQYPLEDADEWDWAGFSLKYNLSEELTGVVVALDVTSKIIDYAIKQQANLIVVHHPFKFTEKWTDEYLQAPYKKRLVKILKSHGINVLALHTNYDNNLNGTSHKIAKALGFKEFEPFTTKYPCVISTLIGLNELKLKLEYCLRLRNFRTNSHDPMRKYNKIAILSGSGPASLASDLKFAGVELIITSDIKWSEWLTYKELDMDVLEVSHLDEQVFVDDIYATLKDNFSDLNIKTFKLEEPYKNI
ncbi:Nif3-like dinuclear metal center hexameric protein [Mycoplasmopsis mucosicanis]|uniref:GTP cyclohydrolase 1 type 2 homolog n=1 Tax=Mycoplasmopsis mucosicanis TaxID=458208 RepID=A0A507SMF5_9BACT|nr:Nif3-like dinuclear metal center hexameric protein [Mycoplasmopsis mucosicanis]TQC51405.1 Nif3-like dinuclear metal center hexameric protein [Mycoplasmopsis mucosicanis]